MDDPLGSEAPGVLVRVRHIVSMREKNVADTTLFGEAPSKMFDKTWGIDEPVAGGVFQKVAVSAEGFPGVETAI
jgi:hypothetical protein